jgi:benzylsuccinate CoA-transferase BbsE subunit
VGCRVLEFGGVYTAYAGKLLTGLGAEVILIEPPGGGTERTRGPLAGGRGRGISLSFLHYHAGQRSLALQPAAAAAGPLLEALASTADLALVDPLAVPDVGALVARLVRQPRLVIVVVGGPAPTGWPMPDLLLAAGSGLAHLTGRPEGPPVRPGGDQGYHNVALQAAAGALAALAARDRTGRGQVVEVMAAWALLAANHTALADYDLTGTLLMRQGATHASPADGLYRCADGWVVLGSGTWEALASWLAEEGADPFDPPLRDRYWQDARRRVAATAAIDAVLTDWLQRRTRAELYAEAVAREVMIAPVRTPTELLTDVQLAARGFFQDDPALGVRYPGPPYRLTPGVVVAPAPSTAPAPGAANRVIYTGELGLSAADLARLRAAGVL